MVAIGKIEEAKKMEIGQKIKTLRANKGITQETLAENLGVSYQAVSRWENSITMPDIQLLPKISIYFGVTIDELFEFTRESHLERIENMLEEKSMLNVEEFNNAENYLSELLKKNFKDGKAYELLAELYRHKADGEYKIAGNYAKQALLHTPLSKDAHCVLRGALNGVICDWNIANHHEIIDYYYDFVEKNKNDWHGYLYLLDNLIADHRLSEAWNVLKKYEKVHPGYLCYLYKGNILEAENNLDEAFKIWNKMIEEYADNFLAWFSKADHMARLCLYDEAICNFEKSMELQPSPRMWDALQAIAHIYEIEGKYEEAIDTYKNIIKLLNDEWNIHFGVEIDYHKREIERLKQKS